MKKAMKDDKLEGLYVDMVRRVREGATRVQAAGAMGNRAALLAEARALRGQLAALVELLEGRLREEGKFAG